MLPGLKGSVNMKCCWNFLLGFLTGTLLFLAWQTTYSLTKNQNLLKQIREDVMGYTATPRHKTDIKLDSKHTEALTEVTTLKESTTARLQQNTPQSRLLCMVNSNPAELDKKATAVNNTWGRRCDILLFVCEKNHPDLPILRVNVPAGREFLSFKHREALDLIYKNYLQEAEWFLKADDDTYVFIDNLRDYLADKNFHELAYYGHHFKAGPKSGYFSGGSGYVFSREAMKRFGQRREGDYRNEASFADDMLIGYAMGKIGVRHVDGRDAENRMLFFPLGLYSHFTGDYPQWFIEYDGYRPPHGVANLTDRPIAFHYITPLEMMTLEYFTYKVKSSEKYLQRT